MLRWKELILEDGKIGSSVARSPVSSVARSPVPVSSEPILRNKIFVIWILLFIFKWQTIYQYYEQTINKIRIRIKMIQIQNNGCRDSGKKWTLLGLEEGRTITPHFPSASEVRGKWQRMPNWSLYSKATRQQKGKRRPRDP